MDALRYIKGLLALTAYWILLFLTLRILFIYRYQDSIQETYTTIVHGLQGDLPLTLSIVAIFSCLLVFITQRNYKSIFKILKAISLLILIGIIIIEYSSILLYQEWGSTLTCRATSYLNESIIGWKTMLASIDMSITIYILIGIIFTILLTWIYEFFFYYPNRSSTMIWRITITIVLLAITTISLRGGLQKIPRNSSQSFFSKNITENFAAVNKLRYLLDSYVQNENIRKYIQEDVSHLEDTQLRYNTTGKSILKTSRPNIILLIMEGIPYTVFDSVYSRIIDIPNLRKIKSASYSYEQMYASGFRTDQGILSLFSALPAYPYLNAMKNIDSFHKNNSLIQSLNKVGYSTSFMYGGDSQFSQLKKYLLSQNIGHISDQNDYNSAEKTMDWGVPDHILLEKSAAYILAQSKPHFTSILTSSTHLPFDFPGNSPNDKSQRDNFIGSLEYLDKSIGNFVKKISDSDQNNLIIITSDHGCLYLGHDFNDHERFRVPFLMLGNAMQESLLGSSNQYYYNTHDLPRSMESLLGLDSNDYPLSADITSADTISSAYWVTEHTMGWLSDRQKIVVNHNTDELYFQSNTDSSCEKERLDLQQYHLSTINHLQSEFIHKQ